METSEDVVKCDYTREELNAVLGLLAPPSTRMWVEVERINRHGAYKWDARVLMEHGNGMVAVVASRYAQTRKAAIQRLGVDLQMPGRLEEILEYAASLARVPRYNFSWTEPTWT